MNVTGDRRRTATGCTITEEASLLVVRELLEDGAAAAGLGVVARTKLVTAGSELARNILVHSVGGAVSVEPVHAPRGRGVRARFADEGPGIADLDAAMTDGFSSRDSLGIGLPGARRLADEFHIDSAPGRGTVVTITMWAW